MRGRPRTRAAGAIARNGAPAQTQSDPLPTITAPVTYPPPTTRSDPPRRLAEPRILIPNCKACRQPPTEPHAVYCCGSMYCHKCLVTLMNKSATNGVQPTCLHCSKPLGEPPMPQTRRAVQMSQVSGGGNPVAGGSTQINGESAGETNQATTEGSREEQINPPPAKVLRIDPSTGYPSPADFSQFPTANQMAAIYKTLGPTRSSTEVRMNLPSRPRHTPAPVTSSLSSISSVNSGSAPPHLMSGPPSLLSDPTRPPPVQPLTSGGSLPSILSSDGVQFTQVRIPPGQRLTEATARSALVSKELALMNDLSDVLPKPPNPTEVMEKRRRDRAEQDAKRFKPEDLPEPVKGPTCPACWDGSKYPVVTNCCQTTFCQQCLTNSLRHRSNCPSCQFAFPTGASLVSICRPAQLPDPVQPPAAISLLNGKFNTEALAASCRGMDEYTLSEFIAKLQDMREQKYKEGKQENLRTIAVGLNDLIRKFKYEISSMQRQMEAAIQDKKFLDGGYTKECSIYGGVFSSISSSSSMHSLPSIDGEAVVPVPNPRDERLKAHFEAFSASYNEIFNKYNVYTNEEPAYLTQNRVNALAEVTEGITKYGTVTSLAHLNYDCEPNPTMSIISSLEFDNLGERFVVAGVTRKIKIFDFDYVVNNPKKGHFPLGQLICRSKISNISWSPETRHLLASSDYDGHVSAWDIERGKVVRTFQEHEKRCWTVHFNNVDPKIMASGSDDSKVKIWNIGCDRSVAQIEAKVNVCCVYFSPTDKNQLVFGSADHCVHLYDIRNVGKPLSIFRGHRKAVSYVRFISPDQVVSASTDSSLRVWNVSEGRCTKVLKGHVNEKNFVGLSGNGDHVMCGSENSRAFFYYKGLSDPLCTYTVGKENAPEEDTEGFVSSVCWKRDSDIALVANSHGRVHILQVS